MKCLVCGREMLDRGTHFECPNILCDYEEEIATREVEIPARRKKQALYDATLFTSSSVILSRH